MSITKDTVKKISKLSRIASNEKFEENMIKDLNAILKFVEQLNEVKIHIFHLMILNQLNQQL